ncbi:MAG TPA: DUF881 domain-containing protein [Candidatus Limnocylindria bacterium]|jgi:uncharacterized protein YlxW (UPF0749 family)|nr:DUF881 domain-containing protein [Candidatus Limnocylindria bacterium]
MRRTNSGAIWAAVIALFLGFAAATQFRSQDVYSRSLNLETPSSLTTLIANLSETNNELRSEIFDLRRDVADAQDAVSSGKGTLGEAERQIAQLRVFSAQSAVGGPGIAIKIDGAFDERALSDLVNELRNAGAEAISVNEMRVGPRSYFTGTADRSIAVDGRPLGGPWTVRAVGSPDVVYVAMTRTGGIIGQFELIYRGTHFAVTKETSLDLPALVPASR